MTTLEELEELLGVEEIHASHFRAWEKRATDPTARAVFRLAADKEENHIGWVKLLMEITRAKRNGGDVGVARDELAWWVEDEASEGQSYERFLRGDREPWVRAVVQQMANDEATNAELLERLLTSA